MLYNVGVTERSPTQFFEGLSTKDGWISNGYDKQFDVQFDNRGNVKITDWSKPGLFSPIRLVGSPEKDEKKVQIAQNLEKLSKAFAKTIAGGSDFDVRRITKAIERAGQNMTRNTAPDKAAAITAAFKNANQTIKDAKLVVDKNYFASELGQFESSDEMRSPEFFSKFQRTFWPLRLNKQIHIKETSSNNFEVYTSSKRWFFQKLLTWPKEVDSWRDFIAKPSPYAAKIASVENFARMVIAHRPMIINHRYNVSGMIANLKTLESKITRNTTPQQKLQIEKVIAKAEGVLVAAEKQIELDRSGDYTVRIYNFTKSVFSFGIDWTVKPGANIAKNWVVMPAFSAVKWSGSQMYDLTKSTVFAVPKIIWTLAKLPFQVIGKSFSSQA